MKKIIEFLLPLIIAVGFTLVAIGVLTSDAFGQNPTGDRNWPLWTRPGQGNAVAYGEVTCSTNAGGGAGQTFLTSDSALRTSIIVVNIESSRTAVFCPTGSTDVAGSNCAFANGLLLKAGAAVTLDRSVLAASTGFTCWGDGGDAKLRFWAEQ